MRSFDDYKKTMRTGDDLWAAAKRNDTGAILGLIEGGAPVDEMDPRGYSPLMLAVYSGQLEAARLLLDRGADPNGADHGGNTILMGASFKGHLDLVRLLLDSGAKVGARNLGGLTALDFANTFGRAEVAVLLRERGESLATPNRLLGFCKILLGRLKTRRR